MLVSSSSLLFLLASTALPLVSAHGGIISHFIREAGPKSLDVCGQAFNDLRTGKTDGNNVYGPISPGNGDSKAWKDPVACNWRLCSGLQYEDNVANTYYYPAGAIVPINVFIINRHAGVANVSIVDTKTNEVVGTPLIEWNDGKYAQYDNVNTCPNGPPVDETAFNVTIPDLGDKCTKGGDCVVQWYWYSEVANNQTFNSCIDFVQPFGGSLLPAVVQGRPDIFEHHAYCHPADQTTTTVYDTATLLNEALSPKTLISLGGTAALPTATTTPASSPSASSAVLAALSSASSVAPSASASPLPASLSATFTDVAAMPVVTTVSDDSTTTSSLLEAASTMITEEAPSSAPTTTVEEVTSANSISSPTTEAAATTTSLLALNPPAMTTRAAVKNDDAVADTETVTINETLTITEIAVATAITTTTEQVSAVVTTTVVEKIYVFMQPFSTSTAAELAVETPSGQRKRHVGSRRLSSHH